MTRVLIVSHEALRDRMSGPSIRNWELARALSHRHQVTLAVPGEPARTHPHFGVVGYRKSSLGDLVHAHDVALCYGFTLHHNRVLLDAPHLVVDLYGPFNLESLHMNETMNEQDQFNISWSQRGVLTQLIRAADFLLCASDRQRDYWLGWMDAVGRINPPNHRRDPSFSNLVSIVPFGLPDEPPRPGPRRLRGVVPGIDEEDFVVIWGGGIWNWFDPLTLVRAAEATRETLPRLRVVFPASTSPSELVPEMRMATKARRLSDDLKLTGSRVFFGDGWVPYEERGAMLLEADVGISLHREDIETRFSFRTRVLDYMWARLPIIATVGDSMADLVAAEELGAVVEYGDVDSVVDALTRLAEDNDWRRRCGLRSAEAGNRFRWSVATRPLVEFCDNPRIAADRTEMRAMLSGHYVDDPTAEGPAEIWRLLVRSSQTLRREGPRRIWQKGRAYFRRRQYSSRH